MKLSILLPWLCTVGLAVGLGALFSSNQKKEAELASLRQDNLQLQSLRAEAETNQSRSQVDADELARLRKNNEELMRLRNEVRQLGDENAQMKKQVKDSQAQVLQAQAHAQGAEAQAEALRQGAAQAVQQQGQANACLTNLRLIEVAKQAWAQALQKPPGTIPTLAELTLYSKAPLSPACPAGGTYSFNPVGVPPTCTVPGHVLPK
jgi:hypothetical protein